MNIDLLPFASFALESSGVEDRPCGEPNTLTLRLARPSLHSSLGPLMSGHVRIEDVPLPCEGVLRAAVLPVDGPGLTITF
jgi:hypothetical protein